MTRRLGCSEPCVRCGLTCTDDTLNADAGGVDLLSEVPHGLVWVLVRVRVDVSPTAWELDCTNDTEAHISRVFYIATKGIFS